MHAFQLGFVCEAMNVDPFHLIQITVLPNTALQCHLKKWTFRSEFIVSKGESAKSEFIVYSHDGEQDLTSLSDVIRPAVKNNQSIRFPVVSCDVIVLKTLRKSL